MAHTCRSSFLSTLSGDEHATEAFRRGARGYLEKLDVVGDLAGAIDQVLDGRMFVPTLGALAELGDDCHHAMLLHEEIDVFLGPSRRLFRHRASARGRDLHHRHA